MKKFLIFLFFLSSCVFSGCTLLETPESSDEVKSDEEISYEKRIDIYYTIEDSLMVRAVWPYKNPYDTLVMKMYGTAPFWELYEDFFYTKEVLGEESLSGWIDVGTKTVIGWRDANGDKNNDY